MNISPVSNIKFGQYYHNKNFNDTQLKVVEKIETALQTTAPMDKEGRSYERYLDAKGYDIITWSAKEKENGVMVVVLKQPANSADKVHREHCEFNYYEGSDVAGIYDEELPFDINDVMKLYNQRQKETRRNFWGLISIPVPLMLAALVLGIWTHKTPKQQGSKAIEKVVQDSVNVDKDTLQLFKK